MSKPTFRLVHLHNDRFRVEDTCDEFRKYGEVTNNEIAAVNSSNGMNYKLRALRKPMIVIGRKKIALYVGGYDLSCDKETFVIPEPHREDVFRLVRGTGGIVQEQVPEPAGLKTTNDKAWGDPDKGEFLSKTPSETPFDRHGDVPIIKDI